MEETSSSGEVWYGRSTTVALVIAVVLIFFALIWRHLLTHLRIFWALWSVPGPLAFPIIGNANILMGGIPKYLEVLKECRKHYGTMFRLWIGPHPFVYLCGADSVQPLLNSSVHIEKSDEYKYLEPWLGTGLITSGGKKWHMRRKLLTGAFHSTVLGSYVESLSREAHMLVSKLSSLIPKTTPFEWSEEIDIAPLSKLCALDAICETIMGYNINALEGNANSEYINAVHRINFIIQHRFITPWLQPDFIFNMTSFGKEFNNCIKVIHNFTERVIKERKEERSTLKENGGERNGDSKVSHRKSFLDLLLDLSDKGHALSDEDIREEVDTFMFAGHDTTATTLNWSLYTLGHHPDVQVRILEEAKSILGEGADREITISKLGKLEYLDCCIKEVLRLYSSVPVIGRKLISPLTIQGHTFPAGTALSISTFLLHRDPTYFSNPDKFDPDRFIGPECTSRHPFAYIPFSAGSRNCIGQKFAILEVKMILLKMLECFEVRSLCSEKDLILQAEILLTSHERIKLAFRKRQHSISIF